MGRSLQVHMNFGPTPKRHDSYATVIGSGHWGKNLVRNLHRLGALKRQGDKNNKVLQNFKNNTKRWLKSLMKNPSKLNANTF